MNYQAVRHIPLSQDAHGIDPDHVVFRLRTGRDDCKRCTLFYADRSCRVTPVIFSSAVMQKEAQDEWFDYYQVILKSPYRRICYYFELDDGQTTRLYYGDFFADERVDDRSEYYQLPYNHPADIASPPEWVQDAVVYNIFPDSFATSRRFISDIPTQREWNGQITHGKRGGTLRGVRENLDYLADLGINCLYLNPIFAAGEYHKYDLLDYYHIDPCFGTDEEFRLLVEDCHARGMRVIIDGVFNHVGWNFFAFDVFVILKPAQCLKLLQVPPISVDCIGRGAYLGTHHIQKAVYLICHAGFYLTLTGISCSTCSTCIGTSCITTKTTAANTAKPIIYQARFDFFCLIFIFLPKKYC